MVETPLPSREAIEAALANQLLSDESFKVAWRALKGILSDEYVDREAIDYEAAYDRFDAILARPEPVTVDTIMANLNSIVDAALGDA